MDTNKLKIYSSKDVDLIPQLDILSEEEKFNIKVVSKVFPFRTNNYVVEELIDWSRVPEDPIYQLTFMQKGMLSDDKFNQVADALKKGLSKEEINK